MTMKYFILFIIFLQTRTSSGLECAMINLKDRMKLDLTDYTVPQVIGTFRKDRKPGSTLPGTFKVYNVNQFSLDDSYTCKAKYFEIQFDEEKSELQFNLKDFSSFDSDVIDQQNVEGCEILLNFKADTACGITNSVIHLKYNILDVNLKEPVFNETVYDLHITFPIGSQTSLIKLSDNVEEIKAQDVDFSTEKLTFKILEEDAEKLFDVKSLPSQTGHYFPVDIIAKDVLNLQESINFTLLATDDGKEVQKLGNTTIKITLNEKSMPPTPEFENPYFQANVDVDSVEVNDIINDIHDLPIKVLEKYKNPVLVCEGENGVMDYFACDQQENEVNVKLIKKPDEDLFSQGQVFVLTIKATIKNDANNENSNAVPFFIALENVPSSTTTTTTTDGTTDPGTNPTDSGTDPTDPGSSSSGSENPPETTTIEPVCKDEDPDSDLITVIIILGIVTCVLLAVLAYGYFKYVRGRKASDKAPLLHSNLNNHSDDISNHNSDISDDTNNNNRHSVDSETYSKPLDALPQKDETQIQNEIDREPKGLDRLIAEQEENNLLKPVEAKSRKRSMTFSESDDESRQYRENLSEPVTTEIINENKKDPVRKKSVVTFKL